MNERDDDEVNIDKCGRRRSRTGFGPSPTPYWWQFFCSVQSGTHQLVVVLLVNGHMQNQSLQKWVSLTLPILASSSSVRLVAVLNVCPFFLFFSHQSADVIDREYIDVCHIVDHCQNADDRMLLADNCRSIHSIVHDQFSNHLCNH